MALTQEEVQKKIAERREETYQQCQMMLQKYGKCAVLRPTGFGKTGLASRLLKEYTAAGKTVLYLYPSDAVKNAVLAFYYGADTEKTTIKGVEFKTYMKLVSEDKQNKLPDYPIDLVIMDEMHLTGAKGSQKAIDKLLEKHPESKLVGLTATPQRSDRTDEVTHFFSVKGVGKEEMFPTAERAKDGKYIIKMITHKSDAIAAAEDYTMHDAFVDGVFQVPVYINASYADAKENGMQIRSEKEVQKALDGLSKADQLKLVKKIDEQVLTCSKVWHIPTVIRENCEKYADTSYMKFICFFSSFSAMEERGKQLRKWFKEAFPTMKIHVLKISSENAEYHENVHKLDDLKPADGHLDLIYACDMLNLGYHVDNITGIVMFRQTTSPIIFPQQFGRVISSNRTQGGLIFDLVSNISLLADYMVLGKQSKYTIAAKEEYKKLQAKKQLIELFEGWKKNPESVLLEKSTEEKFKQYLKKPDAVLQWTHQDQQSFAELSSRFNKVTRKAKSSDKEPRDLIAISSRASYRDIIRKTVAEAHSIRVRQATNNFIECGGEETLRDDNGHFLSRKEILQRMDPDWVPLWPFAKSRAVTEEDMLDYMGVPKDTYGPTVQVV